MIADKIENKQHLSNSAPDLEVKKKTRKRENKLASVKTSSQALAAHLTVQKCCRGEFGRNTGIEFPSRRSTEIDFSCRLCARVLQARSPSKSHPHPYMTTKGLVIPKKKHKLKKRRLKVTVDLN